MLKKIKKEILFMVSLVALIGIASLYLNDFAAEYRQKLVAGGRILQAPHYEANDIPVFYQIDVNFSERFQRPSKQQALMNPYSFTDFETQDDKSPLITEKFEKPEDLLLAYYAVIEEASNMSGYSGGCGSVGEGMNPFPYAYELFTKEKQDSMNLRQFTDSFKGIGHTTLLKVLPAYAPPGTPSNVKYYMVETEYITGPNTNNDEEYRHGSYFAYNYGIAAVEQTQDDGWKIKELSYIPEDFLCAPYHSWFYFSDAVVEIVYEYNMKIVDKIEAPEMKDGLIYIKASGYGNQYCFIFTRLTNGYDILLHEYIMQNGKYIESSILEGKWNLKLSGSTLN